MGWTSQSPDLNPVEMLGDLKWVIYARKPVNPAFEGNLNDPRLLTLNGSKIRSIVSKEEL